MNSGTTTPFYRDARVLGILSQAFFLLAILLIGAFLVNNVTEGLRASNIPLGWGFWRQEAGFAIAEGIPFDPRESYARAFVIGLVNTVRVALSGIVFATVLGLTVGIARLSNNWLVRTLATVYVEAIRNTPLLVQLFFWYFAVILKLPDIQAGRAIADVALISNRGIAFTWPRLSATGATLYFWLIGAVLVGLLTILLVRWRSTRHGRPQSGIGAGLLLMLLVVVFGYGVTLVTATLPANIHYTLTRSDRGQLFLDQNHNQVYDAGIDRLMPFVPVTLLAADGRPLAESLTGATGEYRFFGLGEEGVAIRWATPAPVVWDEPVLQGFNYRGGQQLSPEFAALLIGLSVYTAAFIAEVVRGGISAVDKGQWEASRALGLTTGAALRLVILPQALRIIIPPLTSQYLNLTKNSSLAIAVGYPDLFNVSRTIMNQSGAAVQMFILLMGTYLGLSLLTSAFMNWYNRRIAFAER
jgi:general L-amino acid transport system permease protein